MKLGFGKDRIKRRIELVDDRSGGAGANRDTVPSGELVSANAGFGQIKGGTLYPLLTRLEQADLITTEWRPGHAGPGRKFFSLTDLGRQRLHDQLDEWTRYGNTVSDYLTITRTHQS